MSHIKVYLTPKKNLPTHFHDEPIILIKYMMITVFCKKTRGHIAEIMLTDSLKTLTT
jgi:hypothetical protein